LPLLAVDVNATITEWSAAVRLSGKVIESEIDLL
jgi:hypothetical protein